MKLESMEVVKLLAVVAATGEQEIDYDSCQAAVGRFVEGLVGKTRGEAWTDVRQHLAVCADCEEEYQALLAALRYDEAF